jgi:hypothetical protein
MGKYVGERVRARQLLDGYQQGLRRFQAAASGTEPESAFLALFETLNWAVALDEVLAEIWRPEGKREGFGWRRRVGGEELRAVRYVRNRVQHQWADALWLRHVPAVVLPFGGTAWQWRPLEELPPPDPRRPDLDGQAAYRALVGREPRAAFTLTDLQAAFVRAVGFLEPAEAKRLAV